MPTPREERVRLKPEACQPVGLLGVVTLVVQHLAHRRASLNDGSRSHVFGQQVTSCMFGVRKVYVARVVDKLSIDLLGRALVEAPISRFHLEE